MEFSHPFFRRGKVSGNGFPAENAVNSGHWEMLCHIKRRPPSTKKLQAGKAPASISDCRMEKAGESGDVVMVAEGDLANLLDELQNLRVSQSSMKDTISELAKYVHSDTITRHLCSLFRDKEVLWNEVSIGMVAISMPVVNVLGESSPQ